MHQSHRICFSPLFLALLAKKSGVKSNKLTQFQTFYTLVLFLSLLIFGNDENCFENWTELQLSRRLLTF